jgi:hypothetical protein
VEEALNDFKKPSPRGVQEELEHVLQHYRGEFAFMPYRRMRPEIAKMHEARLLQGIEIMKFLVIHGEAFKQFLEEQKAKGKTP